ncbi:MAG: hypothetical protein EBS76_08705 [Actinobacteria bacterium]|nr:hypothetical protein [Actinomycetota bacterium]
MQEVGHTIRDDGAAFLTLVIDAAGQQWQMNLWNQISNHGVSQMFRRQRLATGVWKTLAKTQESREDP